MLRWRFYFWVSIPTGGEEVERSGIEELAAITAAINLTTRISPHIYISISISLPLHARYQHEKEKNPSHPESRYIYIYVQKGRWGMVVPLVRNCFNHQKTINWHSKFYTWAVFWLKKVVHTVDIYERLHAWKKQRDDSVVSKAPWGSLLAPPVSKAPRSLNSAESKTVWSFSTNGDSWCFHHLAGMTPPIQKHRGVVVV